MPIQWTLPNIILLSTSVVTLLALIFGISALAATGKLNKRLRKWKNVHQTADLDKVYEETLEEVEALKKHIQQLNLTIEELQRQISRKISTAKILRYNAFADTGSDLSYSVALLDDNKNGVVLSSIYGREESRTYGKPIDKGTSTYPLTSEEEQVIQK